MGSIADTYFNQNKIERFLQPPENKLKVESDVKSRNKSQIKSMKKQFSTINFNNSIKNVENGCDVNN